MSGFGNFQREVYALGQNPLFTVRLGDLEELARKKMTNTSFNYVQGSCSAQKTYQANLRAFDDYQIVPRMLVPANDRDCSVQLFGETYASPFFTCPVGVLGIVHDEGEEAAARAAAEQEVVYTMSSAATRTIEEMAEACGDGPRWFQLYMPDSLEVTASYLERARAAGCKVLVVTLDTMLMGFRPSDLNQSYLPFLQAKGSQVGMSDPVLMKMQGREPLPRGRIDGLSEDEAQEVTFAWLNEQWPQIYRDWSHIDKIRKLWKGPMVLKGICSVEDAHLAIKHGMDGILVSNHGGRQCDGARASLDNLAAIAADPIVKKSKLPLLFDSGVRSGADAIKALALGATMVGIGRPYVYGLALEGEEGVRLVLRSILADLDLMLANMGVRHVRDLAPSCLEHVRDVRNAVSRPAGLLGRLRAML